jgi:hypothetical protein
VCADDVPTTQYLTLLFEVTKGTKSFLSGIRSIYFGPVDDSASQVLNYTSKTFYNLLHNAYHEGVHRHSKPCEQQA